MDTPEARLRKLSDRATKGPWKVGSSPALADGIWSEGAVTSYDGDGPSSLVAWCHSDALSEEDAALIVAAVNYVRGILAAQPEDESPITEMARVRRETSTRADGSRKSVREYLSERDIYESAYTHGGAYHVCDWRCHA